MMKEITSVHNAAAQLLRELQKPRARREHGLFVCESAKMVGEAVALHLAQTLFVEKGREAEYAQMAAQAESMGCALYAVSQAVMQAVSTAKTPQGVVCTAKIPEPPKTAMLGRFCARRTRQGLTAQSSGPAVRIYMARRRFGRRWAVCSAYL